MSQAFFARQPWRLVTYWFSDSLFASGLWFICQLLMLYSTVSFMENFWDRKRVLWTYVGLVVLLPLLCVLTQLATGLQVQRMIGSIWATVGLSVIGAFHAPNSTVRAFCVLEVSLKWYTTAFCAVMCLIVLGSRDWNLLISLGLFLGIASWLGIRAANGTEMDFSLPASLRRLGRAPEPEPVPTKVRVRNFGPRPELNTDHPAVERVDALLEKIAQSGIDSLTKAEKDTLQRASRDLQADDRK